MNILISDQQLASLILKSAQLREESWSTDLSSPRYVKPLRVCVIEAFKLQGLQIEPDHFVSLIYILLNDAWQDSIDWAQQLINIQQKAAAAAARRNKYWDEIIF